jgi:uncharacterized protein YxjI
MDYPLTLTFKIIAISPQLAVTDRADRLVFYVKQKAFKLREQVTVFGDREQTRPVAYIRSDRILDISATYGFEDPQGKRFGAVRRSGMKSIWRAYYEVMRGDETLFTIREDNALVKFLDGMLYQIPVLGMVSGYVFHPAYTIARPDGTRVLHVKKQPAMWEGRFTIEKLSEIGPEEEALTTLAILMMALLERSRG